MKIFLLRLRRGEIFPYKSKSGFEPGAFESGTFKSGAFKSGALEPGAFKSDAFESGTCKADPFGTRGTGTGTENNEYCRRADFRLGCYYKSNFYADKRKTGKCGSGKVLYYPSFPCFLA